MQLKKKVQQQWIQQSSLSGWLCENSYPCLSRNSLTILVNEGKKKIFLIVAKLFYLTSKDRSVPITETHLYLYNVRWLDVSPPNFMKKNYPSQLFWGILTQNTTVIYSTGYLLKAALLLVSGSNINKIQWLTLDE